ncbi:MAG TPA: hypothetical protein VMT19_03650, partial [Thermoanaerobaculaceae bacterium]|nr:hypothetical protein [Thermoanaerobaculaceae bacterium]
SRVLVVTPGRQRDWSDAGIAQWVYAGRGLTVVGTPEFPDADALRPDEVVVVSAEQRALRDGEVERLRELATAADAGGTLRLRVGRSGRVVVGSFVAGREVGTTTGGP